MIITRPLFLLLLPALPLIGLLGFRRKRTVSPAMVFSAIARSIVYVLLVTALAGPRVGGTEDSVHVVYAVDTSDSVSDEAIAAAQEHIRRLAAEMPSASTAGVVSFGGTAAVERGLSGTWNDVELDARVSRSESDIAAAVYRGLELLPDDGTRRIVLFTDGRANRGDTQTALDAAASAGVEIDVVAVSTRESDREVLVQSVDAPTTVSAGESYEIRAVLRSGTETNAQIILFRGEELVARRQRRLPPGDSVVRFQTSEETEGWYRYQVFVQSPTDRLPQNNTAATHVQVRGRPVLLYVSQPESASEPFLNALTTQGILVRTTTPADIPADLARLLPNDAVVLDNVPAYDLSVRKMEIIEDYVEGAGGGFLMIGGDAAYGAGGYYRTPIERLLPVDMDITSSMRIPSLAMVFVIDKSGSMGNTEVGGASKLDLVKEAVLSSVEIMNPFYDVGLLAFDADFEWTVPLTPAGEQDRIVELLASLESGGGTILDAALEEANRVLSETRASVKHLVVLSDGLASEAEFEPIVAGLRNRNITVSTVSIGSNANRTLMEDIARWGDGRHYHTASTRNIPRIFTSETTIVSRNLVVEEVFFPEITAASPIVTGFDPAELPPLHGFVLTYPKAGANQPLSGTGENPILATWRYGLGRTAAFTSDVRGKWGRDWIEWEGFPRFVAQLVRWIERPATRTGVSVQFEGNDDETVARIEVRDGLGGYVSGVPLTVRILGPEGEPIDLPATHTGPGQYEVSFQTTDEGDYFVTIRDATQTTESPTSAESRVGPVTVVHTIPYSPEYAEASPDFPQLEEIAVRTGGRLTTAEDLEPYRSGPASRTGARELWPVLSLAALGILLVELLFVYVLLPGGFMTRIARILKTIRLSGKSGRSYDEVRQQILESYRREEERKKDLRTWFRVQRGATKSDRKVSSR